MYKNNLPNYTSEVGYGNLTNDKNEGFYVTYNKPNEPNSGVHHAGLMRHGRRNSDADKIFKLVDTQLDLANYSLDLDGMDFQKLEVLGVVLPKTGNNYITTTITAGSNLTDNRTYDFPDLSGTFVVAPTGVDPNLSNYVTLDTDQKITGFKTVDNDLTVTGDLTVSGVVNFATDEYLVPNGKTITQGDIVEYTDAGLQKRADFPRRVIKRGMKYTSIAPLSNNYAVIAYADDTKRGCLRVVQINSADNSITTNGNEYQFTGANTDIRDINVKVLSAVVDTSAEIILVYQDSSQGGKSFVQLITISSINAPPAVFTAHAQSPNDPFILNAGDTRDITCTVLSDTYALVSYRDESAPSHNGVCQLLQFVLSPTYTITSISTQIFKATEARNISSTTLDTITANFVHALLTYQDYNANPQGKCVILTIDVSSPSITVGTESTFSTGRISTTSVTKMDDLHAMVCFTDATNSNVGTVSMISWNVAWVITITIGTNRVFNNGDTGYISVVRNTIANGTSATVIYNDSSNNSYGMAQVITFSGTTPTPHSETAYYSAPDTFLSVARVNIADDSNYRLCIADSSGFTQCLYIPSSGSATNYIFPNSYFLVGISRETVTGTGLGTYCKVATGGIVSGLSGLVKGTPYWVAMNSNTLVNSVLNAYDVYMGYAIATDKLHLRITTKW